MLEPILQQVGAGNPQLASLISQNPEAFLQLLAEGVDGDEEGGYPGMQTISVTPEEAQAIDRVCIQPHPVILTCTDLAISFAPLVSTVIWSSRPTSLATKMKNSPPTISLTIRLTTMTWELKHWLQKMGTHVTVFVMASSGIGFFHLYGVLRTTFFFGGRLSGFAFGLLLLGIALYYGRLVNWVLFHLLVSFFRFRFFPVPFFLQFFYFSFVARDE